MCQRVDDCAYELGAQCHFPTRPLNIAWLKAASSRAGGDLVLLNYRLLWSRCYPVSCSSFPFFVGVCMSWYHLCFGGKEGVSCKCFI